MRETSCMFPVVEGVLGDPGRRLKATPIILIAFAVKGLGSLRLRESHSGVVGPWHGTVFMPRLMSDPKAWLVIFH